VFELFSINLGSFSRNLGRQNLAFDECRRFALSPRKSLGSCLRRKATKSYYNQTVRILILCWETIDEGAYRADGVVTYRSSHLEGAESEKIVSAGHDLAANPATVAEIAAGHRGELILVPRRLVVERQVRRTMRKRKLPENPDVGRTRP